MFINLASSVKFSMFDLPIIVQLRGGQNLTEEAKLMNMKDVVI